MQPVLEYLSIINYELLRNHLIILILTNEKTSSRGSSTWIVIVPSDQVGSSVLELNLILNLDLRKGKAKTSTRCEKYQIDQK